MYVIIVLNLNMEVINIELRRNCTYCPLYGHTIDTGKHLYINTVGKVYYCQRCNASGKWNGGVLPIDTLKPKKPREIDLFSFKIDNEISKSVYEYCTGRLPESIVKERIRWSPQIDNRAFFPVWSEGEMCMWQGRSIDGSNPKYLTSGNVSQYLYNFDSVDDWAVICEGPFDALSTPHGIALFGKNVSRIQFNLIISKYHTVYWALDKDTRKDKKLKDVKEGLQKSIKVIDLDFDEKDPCDVGYKGMKELIDGLHKDT